MSDKIVNHNVDLSKWNVEQVLGNTLWLWMIDEPDSQFVTRGSGIVLDTKSTVRSVFRIGKVLKAGKTADVTKEGDFVLIPPTGVGIQGHQTKDGYKTLFISEDKILATINFNGTKDEFIRHIKEDLWATI